MFINTFEFLGELKTFEQVIGLIQELDWIAQCDLNIAAILHLLIWLEDEWGRAAVFEFLKTKKHTDFDCLNFFELLVSHSLFSECVGIQITWGEFAGIRYLATQLCQDFSPEWIYSLDIEKPVRVGGDLRELLKAGKQEAGYHESN